MKQLNDAYKTEEQKKVTIHKIGKKYHKAVPLGRVTKEKTISWIWATGVIIVQYSFLMLFSYK